MSQDSKIAPRELIQADFRNLRGNERLDTTPRIEELIFMQSMEGRAHNGSGAFHKRFYVNTSIDDIVLALDRDPKFIRQKRQELIDEITEFVKRVIAGEALNRLVSTRGTPLLGIPLFKSRQVNPKEVLTGIYLGGLRDSPEARKEAEKKYNVTIGYGRCYLLNVEIMEEMGLDGEVLAHQGHEPQIEDFRRRGLIIGPEEIDKFGDKNIRYFYIRHKLGPGQSDDAAIVNAGLLYGIDIALGVFLADAIDTLEKYVPSYSDQDNDLAFFIRDNFKDLDITTEDVYELTHLAAIPEGKEEEVPDSSLRYFLTIDPRTGQTTLESHLNFIEGKPFFPMAISYKRILLTTFYEYVKERLSEARPSESRMAVGAVKQELDIPVRELIKKKAIIVTGDRSLGEALKELREKEADVIIVQEEAGGIIGVVDSKDILHITERRK